MGERERERQSVHTIVVKIKNDSHNEQWTMNNSHSDVKINETVGFFSHLHILTAWIRIIKRRVTAKDEKWDKNDVCLWTNECFIVNKLSSAKCGPHKLFKIIKIIIYFYDFLSENEALEFWKLLMTTLIVVMAHIWHFGKIHRYRFGAFNQSLLMFGTKETIKWIPMESHWMKQEL